MYHVISRMRNANFVNKYVRFWDPLISLERFELEASYLVRIFSTTRRPICHRMTNYSLKCLCSESRDLNLKFGTLHNFWTDKATHSKFCALTQHVKLFNVGWRKIVPLKGCGLGRTSHIKILGSLYIFGVVIKVRNFLFGERTEYNMYSQRTTNWPLKYAWSGSRDVNLKYGTPPYYFRMDKKLCTRYTKTFLCWWKIHLHRACIWSRDTFWNFGIRFIRSEQLKIETSYLERTLARTSQCITNRPLKWGWSGSGDLFLKFGIPSSITFEDRPIYRPNGSPVGVSISSRYRFFGIRVDIFFKSVRYLLSVFQNIAISVRHFLYFRQKPRRLGFGLGDLASFNITVITILVDSACLISCKGIHFEESYERFKV